MVHKEELKTIKALSIVAKYSLMSLLCDRGLFIYLFLIFSYLAELGLYCNTWDLVP